MPEPDTGQTPLTDSHRPALRADCAKCTGLCCVAPAFLASTDFAINKPAGQPCPNLRGDFRCGIHPTLRESGFPGCVAYDCFGAGQRVTQEKFPGSNWRRTPRMAAQMFGVFFSVRQLHELLWYLTESFALPATRPLHDELRAAMAETDGLAAGGAETLSTLDLTDHRLRVNELLRKAAAMARAASRGPALDRRGADLVGADLRAVDFRGADLRGAGLVGANLSGRSLALADVTGADFRGADLSGADLSDAFFLLQAQIESAHGDRRTKLPPTLTPPSHWD